MTSQPAQRASAGTNPHAFARLTFSSWMRAAVALAHAASAPERERVAILVALALTLVALPWALQLRQWRTGDEPVTGLIPLLVGLILIIATRARTDG